MQFDDTNKYYVYIHYNKKNGNPFYVGKGTGKRLNKSYGRNQYWRRIKEKYGFESEKVEDGLNEKEAFEMEIYWISQLKAWGFELCNLTEGGGYGYSGFWKGKKRFDISERFKGHKVNIEARKKISEANKGIRRSIRTEFKKGMIPSNKGISKYNFFINGRPAILYICNFCDKDFYGRKDKFRIFCSRECSAKSKKK